MYEIPSEKPKCAHHQHPLLVVKEMTHKKSHVHCPHNSLLFTFRHPNTRSEIESCFFAAFKVLYVSFFRTVLFTFHFHAGCLFILFYSHFSSFINLCLWSFLLFRPETGNLMENCVCVCECSASLSPMPPI